jgi:ubiquinone/menaquinone biosynthesis C-methylase UbiE/uncharacterized protein YbaR (Trm112 family)
MLDPANKSFEFCCPRCQSDLLHENRGQENELFACSSCNKQYPVIAGIPDFRLYPDPYIDLEADRAKGMRLAEKAKDLSFAELVAFYYSITPEVPPDLAQYYLNHHIAGVQRGQGMLARMRRYGVNVPQGNKTAILDAGCGTGGFLAAALTTGSALAGADIAFRWLIVARKRLQELGYANHLLVCACADFLPFRDTSFDLVVAENLLEHTKDATAVMKELGRVRKIKGGFMARTVNRFAAGPEPHVGVWAVGYLPRPLMDGYVRMVKGIPYEHIHLQSHGSLRKVIAQAGQDDLQTRRPALTESDYQHHPPGRKALFKLYDDIADLPLAAPFLAAIGPYIDITSERQTL